MAVSDYNTDPDLNVDISGINIAEGCPPSGINNAIRQMMADVKTADEANVKLDGTQTISGAKTFTGGITVSNGISMPAGGIDLTGGAVSFSESATISGSTVSHTINLGINDTSLNAGIFDETNNKWLIRATPGGVVDVYGNAETATTATNASSLGGVAASGYVTIGGTQTISGTKTFTSDTFCSGAFKGHSFEARNYYALHRDVTSDMIRIYGGTGTGNGGYLDLFGSDHGSAGAFKLQSPSGTYRLIGASGGNLSWNGTTTGFGSDIRIKQNVIKIPAAVLDAWHKVDWTQYKYCDAVAEKGEDKARWHTGLIAQHVSSAMAEEGQDACAYGILCHEHWGEEYEVKEDGTKELVQAAGEQWMVRYTEALCMEAAYQRRRADKAEARITALEQRLGELEAVLASLISPISEKQTADAQEGEGADA